MINKNRYFNQDLKRISPLPVNPVLKVIYYLGLVILGLSSLFTFAFIFIYPLCYLAITNKGLYSLFFFIFALIVLAIFFYYKLKHFFKEKNTQGILQIIKNWLFKLLMLSLIGGYIIINIVIYSFLEKTSLKIAYSAITILLADYYLFFSFSFLFFIGYYKRLISKKAFIFFCFIYFLNIIYWAFVFIINKYYFYPFSLFILIFVFFFLLKISKIKMAREKTGEGVS